MIRCTHISLHYPGGNEVLKDIDLDLRPGTLNFLAGPTGVGKSSLLSIMALALSATGGTLEVLGADISELNHEELPELRQQIGVIHQDFFLPEHLTVWENVALPLKVLRSGKGETKDKVDEMLAWVGMQEYHHVTPRFLSGGQKQRVAIARSVINNPKIILADEPSANLDLQNSMRFMKLFEMLTKQGTMVLIATHDEKLMESFNYDIYRLHDGVVSRG